MATYDADGITLRKVREYVWEIPREGGMRVPARVLASEALLDEISEDKTLAQIKNTAHLPGIRKHAVCMPDGHQGYGFPVGGVAGIDAEDGCISPGGVGYDINCLMGDSEVLLEFGRRMAIADLADRFESERAVVAGDEPTGSPIRLFTEREDAAVYEVETETGDTIEATADHPFLTPEGMCELGELDEGDSVYVHPFRGVDHEDPEEFAVLTAEDFADGDPQLVRALEDRDLLPLKSTDREFNVLLKLVGYHTGDGAFDSHGRTWFYGDPADLEAIRGDVRDLGFEPSRIHSRERSPDRGGDTVETAERGVKVSSEAFRQLLVGLGAPTGSTVESAFGTPGYLDRLAGWQRARYLSAFFGAEMTAPAAGADGTLSCPRISHARIGDRADAGERFLREIASYLNELDVETTSIERLETDSNRERGTVRFRMGVKNDSENLVRFSAAVGYEYALDKQKTAAQAIQYLKTKGRAIGRREGIVPEATAFADGGAPRPSDGVPGFEEFCERTDVRDDLTIETTITAITDAGTGTVYDIGVEHEAHNFVADGFVVSNCGVRMMKTSLTYDDVRGREEELVDALFANIPSGLGGGGVVETDETTVADILGRGMEWALEEGYAVEDDLAHCEDEGRRPEADPSKVSEKAMDRGRNQVGSLGSGNHFLEVQRVTDVYRDDVADAFGLTDDGIVVLIHCGSRGLGHQVCTDYLREIERTHPGLLDQLPDKELAAAPAGSQLAEDYYGAMCAAINFAWVNRQLVMHRTRRVFGRVFDCDWEDMDMSLLYDVAHNIAKKEVHDVDGEDRELYVHRKGATRAFPAGHPEVPAAYRDVGQPVLIPGSMGTGSYVLRGGARAMAETFGSTAHGAGRVMSRTQAKKTYWGEDVRDDLREQQHVYVKAQSGATVAEEAPGVYKDVDEVVRVSDALGIGDRVARTYPVCNIKG